jgi:hypothetical protein
MSLELRAGQGTAPLAHGWFGTRIEVEHNVTDKRTGIPLDRQGNSDKQGQGVAGFRGERAGDPSVDHPEQRRTVPTEDGAIVVEEASGISFAEAQGTHHRPAEEARAGTPETDDRTLPPEAPEDDPDHLG